MKTTKQNPQANHLGYNPTGMCYRLFFSLGCKFFVLAMCTLTTGINDALAYQNNSQWEITETEISTPSIPGKTFRLGVSISDDGNRYAYSSLKAIHKPVGPYEFYAISEESVAARKTEDKSYVYQWNVDGMPVELLVDREVLDDLFVGEYINKVFVNEIATDGIRMNNPGKLVFSHGGNDWLLAVECSVGLRDGRRGESTSDNILVFWVNGKFAGTIFKPDGSMQSIVFAPKSKHIALFYRYSENPSFARNDDLKTSLTIIDYTPGGYTELQKKKNILPGSADTIRYRLGVKTVFFGNFLAGDIRIINDNLEWAVVTDTIIFQNASEMITQKFGQNSPPLPASRLVTKQGELPLKVPVSGLKSASGNGYLFESDSGVLFFNGVPQKRFEKILGFDISDDGKHYAALVNESGKIYSLVDNKATELPVDDLPKSVEVLIDNELNWRIVGEVNLVNGEVNSRYAWVSNIVWTEKKSSYAFLALKLNEVIGLSEAFFSLVLVKNGVEKEIPTSLSLDERIILPGVGEEGKRYMALTLGQKLGQEIALCGDGEVVASWNPPSTQKRNAMEVGTIVRKNGDPIGTKKQILHPTIRPAVSKDGSEVLFFARSAGEWKLYANDRELAGFDEVGLADSRAGFDTFGNFVFFAQRSGKDYFVKVRK